MQLVWSNLQKLFWNASIANSCNSSDQIYRSYFEMHPLQTHATRLIKFTEVIFWNASIATHATHLIKLTEVVLKCIHCNSCNLSDQIYRSYFEMHPLQLMQLVWSNLQKLLWKCIHCNSCNSSDQIYRSYILKCIHYNSCNSSDQIYRSYFEMHPLQLMQLVWSNLQKLFWNGSIATELQLHMVTKKETSFFLKKALHRDM